MSDDRRDDGNSRRRLTSEALLSAARDARAAQAAAEQERLTVSQSLAAVRAEIESAATEAARAAHAAGIPFTSNSCDARGHKREGFDPNGYRIAVGPLTWGTLFFEVSIAGRVLWLSSAWEDVAPGGSRATFYGTAEEALQFEHAANGLGIPWSIDGHTDLRRRLLGALGSFVARHNLDP